MVVADEAYELREALIPPPEASATTGPSTLPTLPSQQRLYPINEEVVGNVGPAQRGVIAIDAAEPLGTSSRRYSLGDAL
jgi:hypothetical protein